MPDHTAIQLATAVARRDEPGLLLLLDPGVAFRGMTPDRFTEAHGPGEVLEVLLTDWLAPADQVTGIKSVDTDTVADLHRVVDPAVRRQPRRLVRRGAPGLLRAPGRPGRVDADDELGPAAPPDLSGAQSAESGQGSMLSRVRQAPRVTGRGPLHGRLLIHALPSVVV